MQKILIGLYIPALQEKFDVCVPPDMKIDKLIALLAQGVVEISEGHYIPSKQGFLTQKEPDRLLQMDKTLENYGIGDGSQLILF